MIGLISFGVEWFEDAIDKFTSWLHRGLTDGYDQLQEGLFGTPVPETGDSFVFGPPTNEPWVSLHDSLVGGEIMFLALLLLIISVQGRHTIRIFDMGSAYGARKARRSAWTGAFLIVTWYWVAVLSLYLVNGFTLALVPDLAVLIDILSDFWSVTLSNPALALLMASVGGISMWVLQALFFIREILLYIYLYAMPIGIAIAFGGLPVASRVAKAFCMKFVPLAAMPLPVAIFFKGYELLFADGTDAAVAPDSAFLQYLIAAALPLLSLILVWKLFKYASPATAKVIGGTTKAAVGIGAIVGAGYVAGPGAAAAGARWGPKAAAGQAAAQQIRSRRSDPSHPNNTAPTPATEQSRGTSSTENDNVATDAHGQQGIRRYRRTENDPGYY